MIYKGISMPSIKFILSSAVITITTIIISAAAEILALFDPNYSEIMDLPPDGDSLGIPLFGTIIGAFIFVVVSIVFHSVQFAKFRRKKIRKIDMDVWVPHRLMPYRKVKILVIGLTVFLIISSLPTYRYINSIVLLLDVLSNILFFIMVMTIMSIFLTARDNKKHQK